MQRVTIGLSSLEVPDGWTLSTVILVGPSEEGSEQNERATRPFQRNVIITWEKLSADIEIDDYLRKQNDGLLSVRFESSMIGEPEEVTLANGQASGLLTERIAVSPEGEYIRQLQLTTIKDGLACTIIASHSDGEPFEKVRHEFREFLLSFE